MTRILITGASGLLGLNFAMQFYSQHTLTGVVHSNILAGAPFPVIQADLSQPGIMEEILDQVRPEVVLHCAALANVDACEHQPELAWQVNAELPGRLAAASARDGFHLVHLSTDAVFDGQHGDYSEEDEPNPLSTYARTKLAGERKVFEANPAALVARVNFYGWSLSGRRSLGEFFVTNLSAGRQVNGFTDVVFCPLEATLLGEVFLRLVELEAGGLLHVVSSEWQSKYDFGCAVAAQFGLDDGLIRPVSVAEGGLLAARSPDLRLRTDRLAGFLGRPAPGQAECLQRFYDLYQSGYPLRLRQLAGQDG